MNPLGPILEHQGFVVLDGGLATELERAGHDLRTSLWSARLLRDDPDAIAAVHRSFLEAGSDVVASASYQASRRGFAAAGMSAQEADDLIRASVRIAVEVRDEFWDGRRDDPGRRRPLVAAGVGPYGAALADGSEYTGAYDTDADGLRDFHADRLGLLAEAGGDVLAFETIPSMPEIEVLLGLLTEVTEQWAWVSFQCRNGTEIADGTPFEEVVRLCDAAPRVAAVGVNCTDPAYLPELLATADSVTDLPLLAYPNSGEEYDATTKEWSGDAAARWSETVLEATRSAEVVGGCCRVRPDHIAELRRGLVGRASAGPE